MQKAYSLSRDYLMTGINYSIKLFTLIKKLIAYKFIKVQVCLDKHHSICSSFPACKSNKIKLTLAPADHNISEIIQKT